MRWSPRCRGPANARSTRLSLAAAGYRQWRQTPLAARADALRRIGAELRARGEEVAQTITLEMGKPIAQARGEVAKSANLCDWYAEHGPAMLATEATPGGK